MVCFTHYEFESNLNSRICSRGHRPSVGSHPIFCQISKRNHYGQFGIVNFALDFALICFFLLHGNRCKSSKIGNSCKSKSYMIGNLICLQILNQTHRIFSSTQLCAEKFTSSRSRRPSRCVVTRQEMRIMTASFPCNLFNNPLKDQTTLCGDALRPYWGIFSGEVVYFTIVFNILASPRHGFKNYFS